MIYEDDINGLTIYHHGTKGQKWGVRRYEKKQLKKQEKSKKLSSKILGMSTGKLSVSPLYTDKKGTSNAAYKRPSQYWGGPIAGIIGNLSIHVQAKAAVKEVLGRSYFDMTPKEHKAAVKAISKYGGVVVTYDNKDIVSQ